MMSENIYFTKKGKFSHELALNDLKEIQTSVRSIASEKPLTMSHTNSDGVSEVIELTELPLDILLNQKQKQVVSNIAKSFAKGNSFEENVSSNFIYEKFLKLLAKENFYLADTFTVSDSLSLFENLRVIIEQEISTVKLNIITVIGASLKKGNICEIGSIKFMNPSDFIDKHKLLFESLVNYNEGLQTYLEVFHKSDLVAQVSIKNRDTATSKMVTNEIMKRIYTLIRLTIPSSGGRYNFFGTLGEEYLESRFSFLFHTDSSNEEIVKSISVERTSNRFSDSNIDLIETILPHKQVNQWFTRIELIISKFVNDKKLTDFEKRIWTALYWYGESMSERELNPLIIKYATCLEALFNSREGGISEQISEFTAYVVGKNKDERMKVYSNIKKLYSLRSTAVHGGSVVGHVDSNFLSQIMLICESALLQMAYYSQEDYYQNSKGYEKFVQYILREYRFI
ncbi:MAG: hypothetical protein RMX68_029115 [Aulosira sp. ZfuVER01]|nr:HEPN domain-containing protein [Aulosira sp. ZfuVER01]MDZ8002145.1 HEPN domain-containing protein [Aulosira sp. DedVER01a]MDZ8052588.1 HEPN domain-containing protein [Aulosira sp. ZfuCHP01]